MKQFIAILGLIFAFSSGLQAQNNSSDCDCAAVVQKTLSWCDGSRGGQFCFDSKGVKKYKKKDTIVPERKGSKENPLVGSRGGQYYWKLSNNGNWYKVYLSREVE